MLDGLGLLVPSPRAGIAGFSGQFPGTDQSLNHEPPDKSQPLLVKHRQPSLKPA